MIENIMSVIFFVIFVITILIIMYFIYDYLQYKDNVDKSIRNASKQINKEFNKVIDNVDTTSSNILLVDEKVNNYNESLKKFFSFNDSQNMITNEKMFNHSFEGIVPNLNLLTQTTALGGLNVNTSSELLNSGNLKICDDHDSCVNMNVNQTGFNITPNAKVSSLTINNKSGVAMSKYDVVDNAIYLGGNTESAPFYIKNNNVYMKNAKLKIGDAEYEDVGGKFASFNTKINDFETRMGALGDTSSTTSLTDRIISLEGRGYLQQSDLDRINQNDKNRGIIVQYFIKETIDTNSNKTQHVLLHIHQKVPLNSDEMIQIELPQQIITELSIEEGKLSGLQFNSSDSIKQTTVSKSPSNSMVFNIQLNQGIALPYVHRIYTNGGNLFTFVQENGRDANNYTGVTYGVISKINANVAGSSPPGPIEVSS